MQFTSTTQALMRYIGLYRLLAVPRSIPLKKGATHVSRTESFKRWEAIRHEFAELALVFPSTRSEAWTLLLVSVMTNLMPEERRKYVEYLTGHPWTAYLLDRRTNQAYGEVAAGLRAQGKLLTEGDDADGDDESSGDREFFHPQR